MPNIFLRAGQANPNDVKLVDPTSGVASFSYVGSGGLTFAGSAPVTKEKVVGGSGGLTLGGSAATSKAKTFAPSGGIVYGGAATFSKTKAAQVSGGLQFGGTAATTFSGVTTYAYTGTGGVVFSGAATTRLVVGQQNNWARWWLPIRGRTRRPGVRYYVGSGGIKVGGSARTSFVRVAQTFSYTGRGAVSFGGAARAKAIRVLRAYARGRGGIELGGTAETAFRPMPRLTVVQGLGNVVPFRVKRDDRESVKAFRVKR